MKLDKKKDLATRTLKVGRERIVFVEERLEEIKSAITKQDIRDLKQDGAIVIKEITGSRKNTKRKNRRGPGKVKKKVKTRKKDYVTLTRKLRGYISNLKKQGKVSREEFKDIRKKIRNKAYRSKSHLRENMENKK